MKLDEIEYVEDVEWKNYLKNNQCPYCENQLTKHRKGKHTCNRCKLTLLGDPFLLSFKIKEVKIEPIKEDHCPECKSPDLHLEEEERETVCLSCGLVVKGSQHYTGYTMIKYPFGHHYERELKDGNNQIRAIIG